MYADDIALFYDPAPCMFDVDKCLVRMDKGIHRGNVSEIGERNECGERNRAGLTVGQDNS